MKSAQLRRSITSKNSSIKFIDSFLNLSAQICKSIDQQKIYKVIEIIKKIQKKNGRIFFIGVGGSAGNTSHAVNDFRKLLNIECYSATDNVSEITARTNDEGWDTVFNKYLEVSKINKNDLLFVFSVGGGNFKKKVSINLINGMKYAHKKKLKIISFLGRNDGYAAKNSDVAIIIPNSNINLITPIAETFQALLWHLLVSHPDLQKNKTKW